MVQSVIAALIAFVAIVTLAIMSLRANARFRGECRLPMQWSLQGKVNWSAPRPVALAFTPVFAACLLGFIVIMAFLYDTRPGQEDHVIPVMAVTAALLVGIHALHIRLISRTIDRRTR